MLADKGKRARVEEESEPIDGELVVSIEKLQDIQEELDKIEEEITCKLIEVEQKYNVIRRPSYNKRNEIIQTIPDFWLTSFLSHPALGELLTEDDQKVFKYLKSLDVEDSKDVKSGFTVTFMFSPNPYFKNEKLAKSYSFFDDGTSQTTGTTINWKDGNDITKCADHEKKGKKRPLHQESFFSWFGNSSSENLLDGMADEIADLIREDLWPNPLRFFNNEADDDDFEGDFEDIIVATEKSIAEVKLTYAAKVRAVSYSGGMKRRLSVAITPKMAMAMGMLSCMIFYCIIRSRMYVEFFMQWNH